MPCFIVRPLPFARQVIPPAACVWYGRAPPHQTAPEVLTLNSLEKRIWEALQPKVADLQRQDAELTKYIVAWEQEHNAESAARRGSKRGLPTAAPSACESLFLEVGRQFFSDQRWVANLDGALELASQCMQLRFSSVYLGHDEARTAVLQKVRLVYATHDVGQKMLSNVFREADHKALLAHKPIKAIVLDEVQRVKLLALLAFAGHSPAVVGVGDGLQELPQGSQGAGAASRAGSLFYPGLGSSAAAGSSGPGASSSSGAEGDRDALDVDATHLRLTQHGHSATAFLERPGVAEQHNLSTGKRFGYPALGYFKEIFAPSLDNLEPMSGLSTQVEVIRYHSRRDEWWSLEDLLHLAPGDPTGPLADTGISSAVAWNTKLFAAVALRVLQYFKAYAAEHAGTPDQPIVLVTAALKRLLGPLSKYLSVWLSWQKLRWAAGVNLDERHVTCRTSGHVTGPTFPYVIVLRHRRLVDGVCDAHLGLQASQAVMYTQMTRTSRHLTLFLEAKQGEGPKAQRYAQLHEAASRLQLPVTTLGAEDHFQPLSTRSGLPEVSQQAEELLTRQVHHWVRRHHSDIVTSTALLGSTYVLGELVPGMGKQPVVVADLAATRRACSNKVKPAPVFGHSGSKPKRLEEARELGMNVATGGHALQCWRFCATILDALVVLQTAPRRWQIAVPMLSRCPGIPPAPYSAAPAAHVGGQELTVLEPEPSLQLYTALAFSILAHLHKAESGSLPELVQQTRPHKASVKVDKDPEAPMLWWTKQCNSNRAAETLAPLLDTESKWNRAEDEQQRQGWQVPIPEFCPARDLALYSYYGGGISYQPECVAAIVVRAAGRTAVAAAVLAARLLSLRGPSAETLGIDRARIRCNWEPEPPHCAADEEEDLHEAIVDAAAVLSDLLGLGAGALSLQGRAGGWTATKASSTIAALLAAEGQVAGRSSGAAS